MIIWKRAGIIIPVLTFVALWSTKYLFDETLISSKLHYGIALTLSGALIFLSEKKVKWDMQRIMNSGDEEKIKKYKEAYSKNPMFDFENSSLFFIPFLFWPYILWAGGITLTIFHFV